MPGLRLVAVAVALTAAPSPVGLPAPAQEGAVVRGRVQIGVPVTTRRPGSAYPARAIHHAPLAPMSEVRNVVVYVRDVPSRLTSPRPAEIRQRDENFIPRVVAVTRGSDVEFPNDDPIYHNVFSLSRPKPFNLGRYPQHETRRVRFDKTGIIKVYCDIHSHMTATVMVFDHPWFAVPAEDGTFVLSGVPPGDRRVTAWHERLGDTTSEVRADVERPVTLDFTLPVPAQ
jgi:plastocyanin